MAKQKRKRPAKARNAQPRRRARKGKAKRHSSATRVMVFNPGRRSAPRKRRSSGHRRRARRVGNPGRRGGSGSAMVNTVLSILRLGGVAFASGLVVSEGTQMALGPRNTGWMGYAGNLVATFAAMWLAKQFGSKSDVIAAGAGGGLSVLNRYKNEQANPVLATMALSGLGDPNTFSARARAISMLRGIDSAPPGASLGGFQTQQPVRAIRTMNGAR